MTKKNYEQLSKQILENVGDSENISFSTHCVTRLRFNVKNRAQVNMDALKDLSEVLGVQWSGEQLQIIIGPQVSEVYRTVCEVGGLQKQDTIDTDPRPKQKKMTLNSVFEAISGCMVPVLPALCAAGVIKGILVLLTNYCGMSTESGLYTLLNTVSDIGFYFMPFLVAVSAAKKFKTNVMMAALIAGIYLHPNIVSLANETLDVIGIPFHILNYSATVFPMIISVWVLSFIYPRIDKVIPAALKFILTPSLTLLVMTPICLGIIGPFGYYLGYYLATFVSGLFYLNPWIGGLVLGAIRPFVLLTGMQTTFTPIILNNLATLGYDFIWPVHQGFAMVCCGIAFGCWLKAMRNKQSNNNEKEVYMSSLISGLAGVSEPTLYGIAFRYKSQLIAMVCASAVTGSLIAGLGGKAYAAGNPSWLFLPTYGDTMMIMAVLFVLAFILSAVLSYILGLNDFNLKKSARTNTEDTTQIA